MTETNHTATAPQTASVSPLADFADSYASFNRIINTLQRKYIELKEDFSAQHAQLAEANRQLMEVSGRNLVVTEFLNSILVSLAAGVIAVDRRGIVTHFNPAASQMLAIPGREPLGKHYREIIPPGEPIDANALRSAESGQAVESVEKTLTLGDGSHLVVSVSTAIMRNDDGESLGAVEVFHDLTKIKKLEREVTRLNTLAALGEMAAAVAHQVRNPLSGILGYGSLLKRDLDPEDPRQKLVARITDGVEALNKTVTTLLDYTRNEEITRERVLFEEYIEATVKQFRRDHEKIAHRMEFEVCQDGPPDEGRHWLQLDPVLVRQVLFNLFTNASEACRGTGKIRVTYRRLPRQKAAQQYGERVMLSLEETVFELVVDDTGPGIAPESIESIFAPFYTTREGGNGLGLAVAWKVIKGHGGEIVAESNPDGGARFKILLPTRLGSVGAAAE